MSYGYNSPAGLQVVNDSISGVYNGQTRPYFIANNYPLNIFRGDLVYLGGDGFIHSLAEYTGLGDPGYQTSPSLGVFNGCSYEQSTAINPTDPANPGRPYWPGGTTVVGYYPFGAPAYVFDDPNIVYTIQCDVNGLPYNAVGSTASALFTLNGGSTQVLGNTLTGQSQMQLTGAGQTTATHNLRIIGFDQNPTNNIPLPGGGPSLYCNALVLIQNHQYLQRAVGLN